MKGGMKAGMNEGMNEGINLADARLDIAAAGCVFPGGPNLALADIALDAQIALIRQHPFYVDRCGLPIRVSAFPEPASPFDEPRWWALAEGALNDLRQAADEAGALAGAAGREIGLWLVLPPANRPGLPPDLASQLLARLPAALPGCVHTLSMHGGHAAGARAIDHAHAWLAEHPRGSAVVLAVDCPLASDMLYWLEAEDLLHGSHRPYQGAARANPYGRIPGEGAAAVLLRLPQRAPAWARLLGRATAHEPVLRTDPRPCLGQGLSEAARQALTQAAKIPRKTWWRKAPPDITPRIGTLLTDLNGEPYRGDEFGFVCQRIGRWLHADLDRLAPALVAGDLGSASLIAHLALSAWRLHQAETPPADTPWHLLLASSDDALRAALVLCRPVALRGFPVAPSLSRTPSHSSYPLHSSHPPHPLSRSSSPDLP